MSNSVGISSISGQKDDVEAREEYCVFGHQNPVLRVVRIARKCKDAEIRVLVLAWKGLCAESPN